MPSLSSVAAGIEVYSLLVSTSILDRTADLVLSTTFSILYRTRNVPTIAKASPVLFSSMVSQPSCGCKRWTGLSFAKALISERGLDGGFADLAVHRFHFRDKVMLFFPEWRLTQELYGSCLDFRTRYNELHRLYLWVRVPESVESCFESRSLVVKVCPVYFLVGSGGKGGAARLLFRQAG